ncbi:MAG TPA: teichoic acid ABC transporter ATP-binding protein, partial [Clostridiales bacterium]|nr:teichoic acid ABC transporter ATP-binding protein [Clostridiales bacterium]
LNGAMLGFSRREMKKKYDSIVEFAELEKFMNVPLKNYSQGMISRLGFAIAVDVNPDVLLIDEILAVGDAVFQKKCAEKIDELRKNGTTFIVVSHSTSQILRLCQNAIYLKDGNVVQYGTAKEVVEAYQKDCAIAEQAQKKQ